MLKTMPEPTVVVPTPTVVAVHQHELTARKLSDLPDNVRLCNALAIIIAYRLFGLNDEDIANATGVEVARIDRLASSDAYNTMRDAVVRNVVDGEAASVRGSFQLYSRDAVSVLVDTMNEGRRVDKLAAARDILDRAGHRPVDVIEHRHKMEGGLTIEVIRRDEKNEAPVIDLHVEDRDDATAEA
jgi:hypothetical protein